MGERILGAEDKVVEMDTSNKKNLNLKVPSPKHWDTMKRRNLQILGIEEEEIQVRAQKIFNKRHSLPDWFIKLALPLLLHPRNIPCRQG